MAAQRTYLAISTGVYGYPLDAATEIAVDTVTDWLQSHADYDMRVIFCCFDARTEQVYHRRHCRSLLRDAAGAAERNLEVLAGGSAGGV